ncbi:hypothetical protein M758_10G067200 [Ceratodon purpureus]|nr:hypothetical protein M758_10G067200 [Ceratodon purpureus]
MHNNSANHHNLHILSQRQLVRKQTSLNSHTLRTNLTALWPSFLHDIRSAKPNKDKGIQTREKGKTFTIITKPQSDETLLLHYTKALRQYQLKYNTRYLHTGMSPIHTTSCSHTSSNQTPPLLHATTS